MDYGQIIAQDLAEAEAFADWKSHVAPLASMASSDTARNLSLLRQELMHLAAMINFNASVANWLVWHPGRDIEVHHRSFKPAVSTVAGDAIRAIAGRDGCNDVLHNWQSFSARLNFAIEFAATIVPTGLADPVGMAARELLSDVWRRACAALLDVQICLASSVASRQFAHDAEREGKMLEALQLCADGGWPCITPEGHLQVPGWADRRRAHRISVSGRALLVSQGKRISGALLDATPYGLKIAVDGDVAEGADVTVILPNQMQHAATVVWARDLRVGVRLGTPLDIDALLAQGGA